MTINLENFILNEDGGFGLIIIDKASNCVFKLFRSYKHKSIDKLRKPCNWELKFNKFREQVYKNENNSYKTLQKSKLLKNFTPEYYGEVRIEKVVDRGVDVSEEYLLNCCFKLEYIEGKTVIREPITLACFVKEC